MYIHNGLICLHFDSNDDILLSTKNTLEIADSDIYCLSIAVVLMMDLTVWCSLFPDSTVYLWVECVDCSIRRGCGLLPWQIARHQKEVDGLQMVDGQINHRCVAQHSSSHSY